MNYYVPDGPTFLERDCRAEGALRYLSHELKILSFEIELLLMKLARSYFISALLSS